MSKWEEQKFGDLYLIPSRNGLTCPSSVRGAGYKFINMGEIFAYNRIGNIETELVQLNEKEKKEMTLQKNDLLFARQSLVFTGAGKCSIMLDLEDVVSFESHIIRVRLNPEIANPMFYYYYFSLPYNSVKTIVQQCAQAGIRGSDLEKIKVPCPYIEIQKQIADILSAYDNLIEANNRRIELLEQAAQELYKEWFVRFRFPGYENAKFEDGIPKGWTIKRLADYGRVETGKTPSTDVLENYGGEMMFVKTPDMHGNIFIIQTEDKLSERGHNAQPKKLLPANSIMVSCIGTAGVVSINAEPAHTNQQINSIILNNPNELEWLYHTCKSLKDTIELFGATGATMTNLSKGKFEKLKVVDPREDLILEYHNKVHPLFNEIKSLMYQNQNLAAQRDMLLPRLMSGKLEV